MADLRIGDYQLGRRRSGAPVALSFLAIGLGLGAVAALLLTPKTGRQLRKQISRNYEDARDRVSGWGEHANNAWERGQEWAEAARRKAEPVAKVFRRA